jgi:lysophospholipase L1-like esterase
MTTVACLGSSSTAAKGSFDWIRELQERPSNSEFQFRNLGVGGDLAYNALQRLPSVLACRPDEVVILLGGNDVLALVSGKVRRVFSAWKRLPCEPSPKWFGENLQAIVQNLKKESSARIALCSLPPMGEDPHSCNHFQAELNRRVAEYSGIVWDVARNNGVNYLPVYERLEEQIVAFPGPAFTSFRFLSFYRNAFRQYVLRQSLDRIAERNGWRFHIDGIHLNGRSGMILANLVQEYLTH